MGTFPTTLLRTDRDSFDVNQLSSGRQTLGFRFVCIAHPSPVHRSSTCHPSPCNGFSPSPTTTMAPYPWGSRPVGHPAFRWCCTCKRDVGAPFIPLNVLAAHRPSCEEYAPRNLDGTLMMAPQPGVVAASVKCHRWRLGFGQSSSHLIARVSQDDTVHAFP
jgi:hypothetical protein